MTWFLLWLAAAALLAVWHYAATRNHTDTKTHRHRMARAQLCLEAAAHWNHELATRRLITQAYKLCFDCGCPPDDWPAGVVAIHVGTWR